MTKEHVPALAASLQKKKGLPAVLLSFLWASLGAFVIFLPFLIVDKGFFVYTGDYNLQQIPFYMYVHQFIKTGGGTWSWATDIGSSVVNSYAFYNIGSPFLWLSLLFPSRWMPFLMVPLFIVKFATIAATSCLYFTRYSKTKEMAVICSLIYAFCGFNTYNIFFNHMLDPVALFPLLLWALDGFVMEKKRGFFALFVGLALLDSYFFFIGNVVFLFIYFFAKVATKEYTISLKEFGLLSFEVVLGLGIGMVLALPSYFNLIGNPRTDNFANGFNLIMYWEVQQYFEIFTSMILPPDPPWWPNLFTEGAIRHTSMSAFLHVVGIAGVVAYWKARKKSAAKIILLTCFIFAMVPILNSSFYAFNASYYARWYYMPALMMCFATLRSLEDADIDLAYGAKVALYITTAYAIFGLLPIVKNGEWQIGLAQNQPRFWITLGIALLGVGGFYFLVTKYRGKVKFAPLLLAAVLVFSSFYTIYHIGQGKVQQWNNDSSYRSYMYDASGQIQLPDDGFYRIDSFGTYDNLGLWMNKSGLQTFNSTVTPSIMEFYPMLGVKRDVSSHPSANNYALRGLLSVRYTLVPLDKIEVPVHVLNATPEELKDFEGQYSIAYDQLPVPFDESKLELGWTIDAGGESYIGVGGYGSLGWKVHTIQAGYAIFENENFVPLGFTYDEYISMNDLMVAKDVTRSSLLMHGIGLTDEQVQQYAHLFRGAVQKPQNAVYVIENTQQVIGSQADFTLYEQACAARRASSSYDVQADSSGFTSKIELDKENLVFFGVPYDSGFTATVNGAPVEVLKVSGGMMAVHAPAGDNTIVFRYKTPGMGVGAAVSALCLLILLVYMALAWSGRKRQKVALGVSAGDAVITQAVVPPEPATTGTVIAMPALLAEPEPLPPSETVPTEQTGRTEP